MTNYLSYCHRIKLIDWKRSSLSYDEDFSQLVRIVPMDVILKLLGSLLVIDLDCYVPFSAVWLLYSQAQIQWSLISW